MVLSTDSYLFNHLIYHLWWLIRYHFLHSSRDKVPYTLLWMGEVLPNLFSCLYHLWRPKRYYLLTPIPSMISIYHSNSASDFNPSSAPPSPCLADGCGLIYSWSFFLCLCFPCCCCHYFFSPYIRCRLLPLLRLFLLLLSLSLSLLLGCVFVRFIAMYSYQGCVCFSTRTILKTVGYPGAGDGNTGVMPTRRRRY